MNEFGKLKCTQLFYLAKAVLSLNHGNGVPEKGFSINKYLLFIHGNSIYEKAVIALKLVKDFNCFESGFSNIIIMRELLIWQYDVKSSYSFNISNVFGSPTKV